MTRAASNGQLTIVKLLIDAGADKNATVNDWSLVMWAACSDDKETISYCFNADNTSDVYKWRGRSGKTK